jgi:hypothetical protein
MSNYALTNVSSQSKIRVSPSLDKSNNFSSE